MENTVQPVDKPFNNQILKRFTAVSSNNPMMLLVVIVLVILTGVFSGWLLTGVGKAKLSGGTTTQGVTSVKNTAKEAGLNDSKTFPDTATGDLAEGGILGEGTHHLVRPGGDSQNVYLTSTVIDLQSFVGKKVQIWGQTTTGKNAGWMMDVGKIKVLE